MSTTFEKLSPLLPPAGLPGTPPAPGDGEATEAQAARAQRESKGRYGEILKSSALIGGSSVLNIAVGIIRTKAMAMMLGTSGVGLIGIYGSIMDLARSVAGMGIQSSGVRQIAESVGSGDTGRIARTVVVLRRCAVILGMIGAALLVAVSKPMSTLTFGTDTYTGNIALLSLGLFFGCVAGGQAALVQGMRRIADLAKMSVLGTLFGALVSIPIVYVLREAGIVPALVAGAGLSLLTSWWYSRKIDVCATSMTLSQVFSEAKALLKLGFVFMASGLMTLGAAYVIRIIVLRGAGFEAAGLYQAAWALGGLYVGFILQAMGADFYPRLTAVAGDHEACNRMVNEQAHVSLLLAGPGVLATITLSPLVIALFYTSEFTAAVAILRWICLGMVLRVVAWPMGFIVLAKGAQAVFFWTELLATIVHIGLAWGLVPRIGVNGAGIAFFGLYVWHGILIYFVVRRMTGFRWSSSNRCLGYAYLATVGCVFSGFYLLPPLVALAFGVVATALVGWYSLRSLCHLTAVERLPGAIRKLLAVFRLLPVVADQGRAD